MAPGTWQMIGPVKGNLSGSRTRSPVGSAARTGTPSSRPSRP